MTLETNGIVHILHYKSIGILSDDIIKSIKRRLLFVFIKEAFFFDLF